MVTDGCPNDVEEAVVEVAYNDILTGVVDLHALVCLTLQGAAGLLGGLVATQSFLHAGEELLRLVRVEELVLQQPAHGRTLPRLHAVLELLIEVTHQHHVLSA